MTCDWVIKPGKLVKHVVTGIYTSNNAVYHVPPYKLACPKIAHLVAVGLMVKAR